MKKPLKYMVLAVLGIALLFLFVANFSITEVSFKCSGKISYDGATKPMTIYMKLIEYRPWVGLWSDSNGSVSLEIPNELVVYYGHIEEVGDQLQIYETYPQKALKGNFSTLSKTLAIDFGLLGFFDGTCGSTN